MGEEQRKLLEVKCWRLTIQDPPAYIGKASSCYQTQELQWLSSITSSTSLPQLTHCPCLNGLNIICLHATTHEESFKVILVGLPSLISNRNLESIKDLGSLTILPLPAWGNWIIGVRWKASNKKNSISQACLKYYLIAFSELILVPLRRVTSLHDLSIPSSSKSILQVWSFAASGSSPSLSSFSFGSRFPTPRANRLRLKARKQKKAHPSLQPNLPIFSGTPQHPGSEPG